MAIAAQASLYPLRQPRLSPAIDRALGAFRSYGLEVIPGTMSSVISGEDDAVFAALREVFQEATQRGEVVMVVTLSNTCPVPEGG